MGAVEARRRFGQALNVLNLQDSKIADTCTFFNSSFVLLPLVFGFCCCSKKLSNAQQELSSRYISREEILTCSVKALDHIHKITVWKRSAKKPLG